MRSPARAVATARRAVLALALGAVAAGAPLAAQEVQVEPRGLAIDEVPRQAVVDGFEIVGNEAFSDGQIKRRLYTEATSGLPFFRKTRRLNKDEFLKDLRRVVVFYQQHGYFDADVEGYGIRRKDDEAVELSIFVHEGQPSTVDTLRVDVVEAEALEPDLAGDLRERVPLQEGDVFSEARIDSAQAILTGFFQNRGYAFAEVLKEYRIDKDERSATVIFAAYPGDLYHFGRVRIEGETDVNPKLIRGQVQFSRGDLYELDKVYGSQRRLYQLNLFRRVEVQPQYENPIGDTLPVVISVADAEEHLVRLGLGYGSEELVRVSASWLDRNFFGGARQARVAGEYSQLRRGLTGQLTQPNVLVDDLSATGTGFFSHEVEDTYSLRRLGGSGRINHEVSADLRTFYGLNIERDTFTEIDSLDVVEALVGEEFLNPSTLSYVEFGALLDTTDDIFAPTEGNTVNLNYHLANTVLTGDYSYHRVTLLGTHYQELRRGWVLAFKVLPGIIRTFGESADESRVGVPLFERLFAGGSTSVRGYQRRRLGPLTDAEREEDRDPVGGRVLLEGSVEMRFPLFGNFRGVGFLDAGNVWRDTDEVSLSELRYTPGFGVRYDTPVGPVRLDAGFKTRDEDPGPPVVLHVSIGNAF